MPIIFPKSFHVHLDLQCKKNSVNIHIHFMFLNEPKNHFLHNHRENEEAKKFSFIKNINTNWNITLKVSVWWFSCYSRSSKISKKKTYFQVQRFKLKNKLCQEKGEKKRVISFCFAKFCILSTHFSLSLLIVTNTISLCFFFLDWATEKPHTIFFLIINIRENKAPND